MLYFRKGKWHEVATEWEEPLFQPVIHLADGYYLDAILAGHSTATAINMAEKRLYGGILDGAMGYGRRTSERSSHGQTSESSRIPRKKHNSPKNKKKYA